MTIDRDKNDVVGTSCIRLTAVKIINLSFSTKVFFFDYLIQMLGLQLYDLFGFIVGILTTTRII